MASLKPSRFNIVQQLPDGKYKIVNTLWRSLVETTDAEVAHLLVPREKCSFAAPAKTAGTVAEDLLACGMLVPGDLDEFEAYKRQFVRWTRTDESLHLTFAPTFRCNFACVYCVQEPNFEPEHQLVDITSASTLASCSNADIHNAKKVERSSAPPGKKSLPLFKDSEGDGERYRNRMPTINPGTIHDIVRWTGLAVMGRGYRSVAVNIFGGEPLLEYQRVVEFMEAMNAECRRLCVPTIYQIVTNGFLATRERLARLRELGLNEAQITIDGLRENHNRRRSMGKETYDRIWKNVVYACELGVKVLLLTVIDRENVDDLKPHIDRASALGQANSAVARNLELQFGELFETNYTLTRTQEVMGEHVGEIIRKRFEAYEYAKRLGVATNNPFLINSCARESEDSVLIGPQGDIYKCYSTIGDKRHQIGSVLDPPGLVLDGKGKEVAWVRPFMQEEDCSKCDIVPYCRSGCQFVNSLYNEGLYGAIICDYENLKAGIVAMIERDVV